MVDWETFGGGRGPMMQPGFNQIEGAIALIRHGALQAIGEDRRINALVAVDALARRGMKAGSAAIACVEAWQVLIAREGGW